MPKEDIGDNDFISFRGNRIPRAPNLKFTKLLLKKITTRDIITLNDYRLIAKSVLGSSQLQYTNEYLKLLLMLKFVKKVNKIIVIPESTKSIIRDFTDKEELTTLEKDVFQNRILDNISVRWFIETIFGYDIKRSIWLRKSQPLTSKAIAQEYIVLTGLSIATGRREARLITNWLGQIGLLEQSYTSKYYLTVGELPYSLFERIFEEKYHELEAKGRSGIKWVEIAPIQASICESYNISKEVFDNYFRQLVELKKGLISISPGSAGLKEVKRFGVEINNRLIYYMRFNR